MVRLRLLGTLLSLRRVPRDSIRQRVKLWSHCAVRRRSAGSRAAKYGYRRFYDATKHAGAILKGRALRHAALAGTHQIMRDDALKVCSAAKV